MTNDVTGLNLPNVMTPGAWAIVGVVLTAVSGGLGYLLYRYLSTRVKWAPLGMLKVQYFAQDAGFQVVKLKVALNFAVGCLLEDTGWSPELIFGACHSFKVYVYAHDMEAGKPGIAGYEANGVIGVNRRLTTLCHELGHLVHERVFKLVDYNHARFENDGINKAEAAYTTWLASQ